MNSRSSGILLHITSLPGIEGTGTLGGDARKFIDFLKDAGQTWWQILPLGPVGYGDSPYQCYSAFAGNPMLIDLQELLKWGLLAKNDLADIPRFQAGKVEFSSVASWKFQVLRKAFRFFRDTPPSVLAGEYRRFLNENEWWLNDYTLFMAAKKHFEGASWTDWDHDLKHREPGAVEKFTGLLIDEVSFRKFLQFCFFRQWFALREYAGSKGIKILGDVPLYVSTDSVDVWTNPDLFVLDRNLKPAKVGGVPPDYFSETGQLWGNPVFNWDRIRERDFDWWIARLHFNLRMFDRIRIDHFRGLESFWSVDAGEATAIKGEWVKAGGFELLSLLNRQIGQLPLIAEDLGFITPEVEKLRDDFRLPGMKILQFAFTSDEKNEYLPHNITPSFVMYTGTHDNDTTRSWFRNAGPVERLMVRRYLPAGNRCITRRLIRMAWASTAVMSFTPMQDLLNLGGDARMNLPGTASGNWAWRFRWKQLKKKHVKFLKEITLQYNRMGG